MMIQNLYEKMGKELGLNTMVEKLFKNIKSHPNLGPLFNQKQESSLKL